MHSKDPIVNDSRQGDVIEELTAVPPYVGIPEFSHTLIVKAINLCDLPAFMVTSDECDPVRVPDFEGEEQEEGLDGVEASIDEITKEKVVCGRTVTSNLEQFFQIPELTMNVSTYLYR